MLLRRYHGGEELQEATEKSEQTEVEATEGAGTEKPKRTKRKQE